MLSFLTKFASVVRGVLCGFDRLFLRGSLRSLSYCQGLKNYLWFKRILYKDFAKHSEQVTEQLVEASLRQAREQGREIRYINNTQVSKEEIARAIAARDRIRQGLICVLRSVDPCMSFQIHKNRSTRKLEIRYRKRKCLHLYHYQIHPVFGFMHARIQTWFPFTIYVCLNGREWLARQMDQVGLKYIRRDNTFTWLEDIEKTQALFNEQLQANWPSLLGGIAETLNPAHAELFAPQRLNYFWSVEDSEWASDVMFRSRAALEAVYPRLIRYAITTFGAVDILRFLGQPIPPQGKIPHRYRREVSTNLRERHEGTRIKHWLDHNSLKLYDKYSVLRTECMISEPGSFKVYRTTQTDPDGVKDWLPMRKGIVDLPHRSVVGQAANERYLEALAAVHDTTPLRQLADSLCAPAWEPERRPGSPPAAVAEALPTPNLPSAQTAPTGVDIDVAQPAEIPTTPVEATPVDANARDTRRRVRALNPLATGDAALLEAVSRHEFLINGLRNRDLRALLFKTDPGSAQEHKKQSTAVTRQLRLLRGHGLIRKVPKTHRYIVTENGRRAITALLAARNASIEELTGCAA